jgi:uncharacterized protein YjbI with pentapeptide repeats
VANEEHISRLKQGVEAWNAWRGEIRRADLREADLREAELWGADLHKADLRGAHLSGTRLGSANLSGADLSGADLSRARLGSAHLSGADLSRARLGSANLSGADLSRARLGSANLSDGHMSGADLREADLSGADLSRARLGSANLSGADLSGANLSGADLLGATLGGANLANVTLFETVFGDSNLAGVVGLETCVHLGASIIDWRTLQKSGLLPIPFLRGVGLPEPLIGYLPALLKQAIQYYSCFISYSTRDEEFAERIHADLQNKGIRCWFAPHDMPIGGKILDEIDSAIRLRDKLLLILSEHSIKSGWVEDEVTKAFEEERKRKQTVLFPIRIDDTVMETNEAWAAKLRARNIGDFRHWTDHNAYKKSLDRVTRDLTFSQKRASENAP